MGTEKPPSNRDKAKPRKEPKYVKTDSEAVKLLEISGTTFGKWKQDPDFSGKFQIKHGRCGWSVSKLRDFKIHKLEKSKATVGGDHADLKRVKLEEEIRGLRLKNDAAAELLIPMDEHLAEVRGLGSLLVRAFDEFTEFALVETKSPVLVEKLESLADRIRSETVAQIEAGD